MINRSAVECMIARTGNNAGQVPPVAYDRQTAIQPAVATRDSLQRMLGSAAILKPHLSRGCARLRSAIVEGMCRAKRMAVQTHPSLFCSSSEHLMHKIRTLRRTLGRQC